jgi:hypothetical protein
MCAVGMKKYERHDPIICAVGMDNNYLLQKKSTTCRYTYYNSIFSVESSVEKAV